MLSNTKAVALTGSTADGFKIGNFAGQSGWSDDHAQSEQEAEVKVLLWLPEMFPPPDVQVNWTFVDCLGRLLNAQWTSFQKRKMCCGCKRIQPRCRLTFLAGANTGTAICKLLNQMKLPVDATLQSDKLLDHWTGPFVC